MMIRISPMFQLLGCCLILGIAAGRYTVIYAAGEETCEGDAAAVIAEMKLSQL